MTNEDQTKILNAGFTIIYRDYNKLRIRARHKSEPSWHNLRGGFETKQQLNVVAKGFLKNPFIIELIQKKP